MPSTCIKCGTQNCNCWTVVFKGKWITIVKLPKHAQRKTYDYHVIDSSNNRIAEIKWFRPWRQYALFPYPNTVWAGSCFNDIHQFIKGLK